MIGERVAQRRRHLKLTQRAIAAELNVTSDTISRIERGVTTPQLEQVIGLARALRVSADWLLGLVEEPHSLFQSSDLDSDDLDVLTDFHANREAIKLLILAGKRFQSSSDSGNSVGSDSS